MRKIALKGLIGQKRDTLLLWSVVVLAFLFLVLSTTLITSLQETDKTQRISTYGSWQIMISDSELIGLQPSENNLEIKLSDDIISDLSSHADESILLPMVSVSGIDIFSVITNIILLHIPKLLKKPETLP